jgi:hypothetical protein
MGAEVEMGYMVDLGIRRCNVEDEKFRKGVTEREDECDQKGVTEKDDEQISSRGCDQLYTWKTLYPMFTE